MRKLLSFSLMGLFALSSGYASTQEHHPDIYTPRTPVTKAQLSTAFEKAKAHLASAARKASHPNHLDARGAFEMASQISLSSQRVSNLGDASSSSGTLTRVSKSPSGHISHAFTTGAPLLPEVPFFASELQAAVDDLLNKTGPLTQTMAFMVQPSSSSSDSDDDSWDDSDSDDSDEDAPSSAPAPVVKRVTAEEARRMQRNSFLKQSSDLDKKIAALARREEEKKKLQISQETMEQREAETKNFYLKSNSIPQFLNKDGRKLTKAAATPSFQRKHTADDAS